MPLRGYNRKDMSSFRPKSKSKSKSKYSNGLPQFYSYKDKAVSNNYTESKFLRSAHNFYHRYKKMLIMAAALYVAVCWLISPLITSFFTGSDRSKSGGSSSSALWNERKLKVKDVFLESWHDYVKHGWGSDIYAPVKQSGKNMGKQPLGWIIVDSLDTLMLMGCNDELEDAKSWVDKELTYDVSTSVSVFETTIRMLGGLLSAHYLSKSDDTVYLEKAVELGNKLISAFNTPSGIPLVDVNLHSESQGAEGFPALGASTAEIATLQLEFKYLSNLTGEAYFWDAAEKVMSILDANQFSSPGVYNADYDGLAPIYVNQHSGKFNKNLIRLGSRGDSYYEYLLKQYLQTNEEIYLDMYKHAFNGIKKHLVAESYPNKFVFLGELPTGINGELDTKMDHLVCFIGGLFALGATEGLTEAEARTKSFWDEFHEEQLALGKEIGKTCYHMYHDTPGTGLSPEIVVFNLDPALNPKSAPNKVTSSFDGDFYIKSSDRHNLQRPETVETLYVLYKITGDVKYREWGWEIFQNFVKFTKITSGDGAVRYTSLKDCTVNPPILSDNMESFWLAETLKYLYLLFDDETGTSKGQLANGNLDKWDLRNMVFNTEAHPLPKFDKASFGSEWVRGVSPLDPETKVEQNKATVSKEVIKNAAEKADSALKKQQVDGSEADVEKLDPDNTKKVEAMREMRLDDEIQKGFNSEFIEHEMEVEKKQLDSAVADNVAVAERMKAAGEKPVGKQPVAKPLNQQVEAAKVESDSKLMKQALNSPLHDEVALGDAAAGAGAGAGAIAADKAAIADTAAVDVADDWVVEGIDTDAAVDAAIDAGHDNAKKIANRMKASGEKPVAKQPIAKPLNEQAEDAIIESQNN